MASSSSRWRLWYAGAATADVACHGFHPKVVLDHHRQDILWSLATSRVMVTCLFLGPISLLIAPNSAIYSEVSVKTDISQLLLLICASEQLCIFVFFSSRFLLCFFSRLLAGSKVGFSVLPLALLCRQMRILTSFNTNKITTWLFLAWTLFSYALGIPANNVSWSGTSGCSCVACHWPDDRLLS